MKKILLATSALAAIASFGASAHVRDGLVESSHNRLELAITGEISAYMGYTSFDKTTYGSATDTVGVETEGDGFGQSYSADIDFTAITHVRNWQIKGVVELNVETTDGYDVKSLQEYAPDANGVLQPVVDANNNAVNSTYFLETDKDDAVTIGDVYVDFTAPYGTFRLGKGAGPSDQLSLEAELPGFDLENVTGNDNYTLSHARFADSYNQIGYYSPNWNGFQFGVAYGFGLDDNAYISPEYNDFVEAAAKYSGEWNAFSFGLSAAYRAYLGDGDFYYYYDSDNNNAITPGEYAANDKLTAGIQLGYMGFNWITTYGQTMVDDGDSYGVKTALTYQWNRWLVGATYEYANESYDGVFDANGAFVATGISPTVSKDATLNAFGVGAEFHVFDGLTWNMAVNYATYDLDYDYVDAATQDYTYEDGSAFQVLTGFDLTW